MLKIKDDLPLEKLKDYGFSLTIKNKKLLYVWLNRYSVSVMEIDAKTKEITNLGDKNGNVVFYDLIKADLVEKVSDNNVG